MIDTVLFDMDGVLLDTEPLWGVSMLRIAHKHGIVITREQLRETTGLRIYEVTEYWEKKYPWQGSTALEVAEEILDDIIALSKEQGRVMPGVVDTLLMLRERGYKIALASSSPMRMIDDLITYYDIKKYFDVVASADSVELGKPHPAVFLYAAAQLNADPLHCVVIEDSVNGMLAGRSARMKVIMIPDAAHFEKPEFVLADVKLRSMEDVTIDLLHSL